MTNVSHAKGKHIKEALGIGRKERTYSPYTEVMRKPEYNENVKMKYSPWIEEIFTSMAESDQLPLGYTPCPELTITENIDDHPLPKICEPITNDVFEKRLKTNAGMQMSRTTNTYSRIGGAYNAEKVLGKEMFKNIAIFPLVATLHPINEQHDKNNDNKLRLISGIIIRAPYHARRPTDRIMCITIELVKNEGKTFEFMKYVNNCLLIEGPIFSIVIRQNAFMKEDSTYNTFTTNALFTPIIMLGCMTLENLNIPSNEDMVNLINSIFSRGESWFLDRMVEGLMFALIGNARDEGYFACLRKMFLILYAWRKQKACASFDIVTFCNKMNDCLIDNPISMYFHNPSYDINNYQD